METIQEQILRLQKEGNRADPLWKKEFNELLQSRKLLTDLELRLIATICAFMRDKKV